MFPTDPARRVRGADSGVEGGWQDTRPAPVFVGRVPELDALRVALASARAGDSQVVMVQGEAGIGKSSLIVEFLGGQRGLPVIAASGETAETVLPYGVVQQLAAGAAAISNGVLASLKLLSHGPGPGADPLAVGMELRALISSLQSRQAAAVVVVVEDMQWADLPSARALLFACRRLRADRVLVVLSCRPEATSQLGEGWARFFSGDYRVSVLGLRGLDLSEIGMLCRRLGREKLCERAVGRVADHTGGNPLLAQALLGELTDNELNATNGLFRAPRSLVGLIAPRLAALSRSARDLVVAASVLGEHATLADAAAIAGGAEPTAALDKAERAGLLCERVRLRAGRCCSRMCLSAKPSMTTWGPNDAGDCICARPRSWEVRRRSATGSPRPMAPMRNWRPICAPRPPPPRRRASFFWRPGTCSRPRR